MKPTNPIHIKFELNEALSAKKEILSSRLTLKRILKKIQKYSKLRSDELSLKLKIIKKIKETKENISKLEKDMPKIKMPRILKRVDEAQEDIIIEKHIHEIKTHEDSGLEDQLAEIQKRLQELQQ